ncbi:hypothetical protein ACE38W_13955 [Chitinophaga sp. Hz27]|uniref:hypothetical protein n=1 Tax=Chitinophaga sp. Hz27 TaxID=3347169 RepID=UPI0035DCA5CB
MKSIKSKFFIAAIILASVGAFAFRFTDDDWCAQPVPGYSIDVTNINIGLRYLYLVDPPGGVYGLTYTCLAAPTNVCRWVKNFYGVYVPCSGAFTKI